MYYPSGQLLTMFWTPPARTDNAQGNLSLRHCIFATATGRLARMWPNFGRFMPSEIGSQMADQQAVRLCPVCGQISPIDWMQTFEFIFLLRIPAIPCVCSRRAVMSGLQHRTGHRARNVQNERRQTKARAPPTRISAESDEGRSGHRSVARAPEVALMRQLWLLSRCRP
jgi:hypothetical protein